MKISILNLIFLVLLCGVASPVEEMTVVKSVRLNFYIQYFILYASDRGALINQPSEKKKRGVVCVCGQNDCSARPQIAKTVSTRPAQARTRPDPQLTALFHAVLCCAVPGQDWLKWLGVHFYLLETSVPKDCAKKMNWADKHMQQPFMLIVFMCVCAHGDSLCVCVCVRATCLCLHTCTCTVSVNMHVCVHLLAACHTSVFSYY